MKKQNFSFLETLLPSYHALAISSEKHVYQAPHICISYAEILVEKLVNDLYQTLYISMKSTELAELVINPNFRQAIGSSRINHFFHILSIILPIAKHQRDFLDKNKLSILNCIHEIVLWYANHQSENSIHADFHTPLAIVSQVDESVSQDIDFLSQFIRKTRCDIQSNISKASLTKAEINTLRNYFISKSIQIDSVITDRDSIRLNTSMLTIWDFAYNHILTEDQKKFISEFEKFMHNPELKIFILKGYAGTGKTFLTRLLCNYLNLTGIDTHLAAPTARAAKILSQKSGRPASTIHSMIYEAITAENTDKTIEIDSHEVFKQEFKLRLNLNDSDSVYIMDEASMIGDSPSGQNVSLSFGSGRLLSDLIEFVDIDYSETKRKLIFIGDNAQLPPVSDDAESIALSPSYFELHFNTKVREVELTQVVRQAGESAILKNAHYLRGLIFNSYQPSLKIFVDNQDVIKVENEELLSVLDKSFNHIKYSEIDSVILAHTNKDVDRYNKIVHNLIFPGQNGLCKNDKILITESNYHHGIQNGEIAWVKDVSDDCYSFDVRIQSKKNKTAIADKNSTLITLNFRKIRIQTHGKISREVMLFENVFLDLERKNLLQYKVAININLKERFKLMHPNEKFTSDEFIEFRNNDVFYNCLYAKLGYALTVHKAQGSEWRNVFFHCPVRPFYKEHELRLIYTGFTRSNHKVYLLNATNSILMNEEMPSDSSTDLLFNTVRLYS